MILARSYLGFLPVAMATLLAVFGGDSARSSEQNIQETPAQEKAASTTTHKEIGKASWYGPGFHCQETASGETFNPKS